MIPPAKFTPAGKVETARVSPFEPPFLRTRRYTGKRAEGVRYEKKVQAYLMELYPDTYVPGPWLLFRAEGGTKWRWCQPDGILIDEVRGIITCIEVKYSHTSNAWWQVRQLYQPVLEHIFPPDLWKHQACEIVKWYDASVGFPEPLEMTPQVCRPSERFKLHIHRP